MPKPSPKTARPMPVVTRDGLPVTTASSASATVISASPMAGIALEASRSGDGAAGEVRRQRDAEHHRDEQEPGLRRRRAGRDLEEQRHEDVDREQCRRREEQGGAGHRDGAGAQQVERDDRIGDAPLAQYERAGQQHGRGHEPEDRRGAPGVALTAPDAGQHERAGGAGEDHRAGGIQAVGRASGRRCGQAQMEAGERGEPEREVDVEHPAPAGVVHEQPADQRARHGRHGEGGRDVALVAAALPRRDEVADGGHGERHRARRPRPPGSRATRSAW